MKRIKLTSFVETATLVAAMGTEVEVTDENREICEQLVRDRGAYEIRNAGVSVVSSDAGSGVTSGTGDKDDDSDSVGGLNLTDPVAALGEFDIHGRYIKALTDAGVVTVADVVAKGTQLVDIPGISEAAAKKIAEVLSAELDQPNA